MKQKNRKYSKFTERKNTSLSYAYKYKAENNLFEWEMMILNHVLSDRFQLNVIFHVFALSAI